MTEFQICPHCPSQPITKEELDWYVEFYKKNSVRKETKIKEVENNMKIWETNKAWISPEVSISVEELVNITMPLTDAVKKWKTLTEMVVEMITEADIKDEAVFVYVNDKEVEPDEAKDVPISSVRKLVISTQKLSDKPVKKTLREKMKEDGIEEKDIPEIPEDKTTTKTHIHAGIVGAHKKSDHHKNIDAQKAHDKVMK